MSKNIKRIVFAGGFVLVIALAFVMLKYVFPEPEPPDESLDTPAPTTAAPVYYVIKAAGDQVAGFVSHYEDGSTFEIQITGHEGSKYEFAAVPEDRFFGYNTSKFRSMMYTMTSLTATNLVEREPEDLSIYGLDQPHFSLTTTFLDGRDITLFIGKETPIKNNYYVMTDNEDTVYTIGGYLAGLIMRHPYEFRNIESFPKYEEEDIYTNINHLLLTNRSGTQIEIWLDKDYSMEGNKSSSPYMMTSPVVSSCATEKVEPLLDVLATISYSSIVTDIGREQLKEYGFDRPARLVMYDVQGNSIDLVIGADLGGSCYAVLGRQYDAFIAGDIDFLTVLRYTETDFEWANLNHMNLLIRAIWIIAIRDVASLTYDFDGEVYEMELYEYDDVTGSGVDVVRTCSYINGKDINETNTKRIFSRTLNFREVGTLAPDTVYEETYTHSITVKMRDGSSRQMQFHKINDRQYACVVDGVAEYYVYLSNIENLTSALERAMDDREVPMVYYT